VSGVIVALAFDYLIYKVIANTSTKHYCPPSLPPDGREQQQVKVSQPVSTLHKPLLPLIDSTCVVNMEKEQQACCCH